MSSVLYNLRNGYDYGFEDSIKLAFYNEIQSIKRTRNKEKNSEDKILKRVK